MKIPVFLSLVFLAIALTGCKTVGPIKVEIRNDGTEFTLANATGRDLHKVHVRYSIWDGVQYWEGSQSLGDWADLETREGTKRFNRGIGHISIGGWCREGRIKVNWDSALMSLD
jgi:hypothetical protein